MKLNRILCAVAVAAMFFTACNNYDPKSLQIIDREDSISYVVGAGFAMDAKARAYTIDKDMVIKGFLETMEGMDITKDPGYVKFVEAFNKELDAARMAELRKVFDANMEAGKKYMANIKVQPNVVEMPNGMCYTVVKDGKGKKATKDSQVKAMYSIYTIDGQQRLRTDVPESFIVSEIEVEGIKEALTQMNAGAKYRFYIPAELAYRDQLGIAIPIGSTIIVDIELVEIK